MHPKVKGSPLLTNVEVDKSESEWSGDLPLLAKLAFFWAKHGVRGKGAIPRFLGRRFGSKWRFYVKTANGCKLAVYPRHLDLYMSVLVQGRWEPWVVDACTKYIPENGVLFDVGANAGIVSNEIGLARKDVSIRGFEPQQDLVKYAARSSQLNHNQNISFYPVAIGRASGTIDLQVPAHALHASTAMTHDSLVPRVKCDVHTIDELCSKHGLPQPDFIKIDVEGGEMDVLVGATQTIRDKQPTIAFEYNDNAAKIGYSLASFTEFLKSLADYHFFRIAPGDFLAVADRDVLSKVTLEKLKDI